MCHYNGMEITSEKSNKEQLDELIKHIENLLGDIQEWNSEHGPKRSKALEMLVTAKMAKVKDEYKSYFLVDKI